MRKKKGKLIIISAPSGSGKSTIISHLIGDESLKLEFSVSATTRPPRGEEKNGVEYYFMSPEEFNKAIENDELVEYQEVYPGRFYGTLKSEVTRINKKGKNVVLDVDVLGAINVKKMYGDHALAVFIKAPSIEVLRERLVKRGTDSPEDIEKRISKAEFELGYADQFDHIVINDVLDVAVRETHQLITDFIKK
ncbi:MAG: guanylate kinase [Muribaculaceae bacterium]|nr:guanylate kinase [Muribaculaceae bacterium]